LTETDFHATVLALATALAVGLVVGLERGWRNRDVPEGGRVAGLRTFALIGLLGGALAVPGLPDLWTAVGLGAVAALFAVSWQRSASAAGTVSITTAVAALATFALGALAARGHPAVALAAAAVVALLLDLKEELHGWLRLVQPEELNAILQLGVLSAVILPLLPNEGFGPYGAVNPFKLWLAVILVAALSLLGHVASRLRGEQQGLLWVGLLGGLASSTAATLALARVVRTDERLALPAAAAIVAASGVMFLRMAVVVSALEPRLAPRLGGLLVLLATATFAAAALLWRRRERRDESTVPAQARLFDLRTAVGFGLALGVIAVLVRAGKEHMGDAGIFAVAFLSGLADVDAIVISTVQMHAQEELGGAATATAIMLAALANMVVKGGMAWTIAGRGLGVRVAAAFGAAAAAGMAAAAAVAYLIGR
jgi:uncharacterized membrane protein (DUF4010 family)